MKKTKIRFILTIMVAVCIAITSLAIPVSATENVEIIDNLPDFGEDYLPSSMINYTIDNKVINQSLMDIVEIIVSNENVEIEANMYSEYIDVFGKLENGKYINITDEVVCEFEDKSIAMWIYGRILAEKKGTTTAVLKYNGQSKEIKITVKNQINPDSDTAIENAFVGETNDINAVKDPNLDERLNILSIAKEMIDMEWTPTKTLCAYGDHDAFVAGTKYTGMPYTQFHIQSTHDEFFDAFNNSSSNDFYESYTNSSKITMPRYGNDCSGFVSICWGLSWNGAWRNRWNTTDFGDAIDNGTYATIDDYADLKPGDALLRNGHIMLVRYVTASSSNVTVYEQTDRAAHESVYTFDCLEKCKYKGFTKF